MLVREGDAVPGGGLSSSSVSRASSTALTVTAISTIAVRSRTPRRLHTARTTTGRYSSRTQEALTELAKRRPRARRERCLRGLLRLPRDQTRAGRSHLLASISGTSGGDSDNEGIYLADEGGVTELAREGDTVPGGNGSFGDFVFLTGLNDSGAGGV